MLIYATYLDRLDYEHEVRGSLRGGVPASFFQPEEPPMVEDVEYEFAPGKWGTIPEEWNEEHVMEVLLDTWDGESDGES